MYSYLIKASGFLTAPMNSLAAASLSILLSIHGPVMQIIKRQDRQGNLFTSTLQRV